MNTVTLTGRLTRDIETRYTPQTQMAVIRNTLAVRGKNKDQTEFISITAFGKLAEMMERYLHKGSLIGITGHIHTGSYEGKNGKVYTTEVVVDSIEFLEKKQDKPEPKQEESEERFVMIDEDLPF